MGGGRREGWKDQKELVEMQQCAHFQTCVKTKMNNECSRSTRAVSYRLHGTRTRQCENWVSSSPRQECWQGVSLGQVTSC